MDKELITQIGTAFGFGIIFLTLWIIWKIIKWTLIQTGLIKKKKIEFIEKTINEKGKNLISKNE